MSDLRSYGSRTRPARRWNSENGEETSPIVNIPFFLAVHNCPSLGEMDTFVQQRSRQETLTNQTTSNQGTRWSNLTYHIAPARQAWRAERAIKACERPSLRQPVGCVVPVVWRSSGYYLQFFFGSLPTIASSGSALETALRESLMSGGPYHRPADIRSPCPRRKAPVVALPSCGEPSSLRKPSLAPWKLWDYQVDTRSVLFPHQAPHVPHSASTVRHAGDRGSSNCVLTVEPRSQKRPNTGCLCQTVGQETSQATPCPCRRLEGRRTSLSRVLEKGDLHL